LVEVLIKDTRALHTAAFTSSTHDVEGTIGVFRSGQQVHIAPYFSNAVLGGQGNHEPALIFTPGQQVPYHLLVALLKDVQWDKQPRKNHGLGKREEGKAPHAIRLAHTRQSWPPGVGSEECLSEAALQAL
jgi:hypothetical protein